MHQLCAQSENHRVMSKHVSRFCLLPISVLHRPRTTWLLKYAFLWPILSFLALAFFIYFMANFSHDYIFLKTAPNLRYSFINSNNLRDTSIGELDNNRCSNGFFTAMYHDEKKNCVDFLSPSITDMLKVINAQMKEFNTKFTMYITLTESQNDDPKCIEKILPSHLGLTAIIVQEYNSDLLLKKYSYNDMDIAHTSGLFKKAESDILRLVLAAEHRQTYIDPDTIFLSENYQDFVKPFVAVHVWNEFHASLEMTNAAFCLPKEMLLFTIQRFKEIMISRQKHSFYTELGPSLFQKTVTNWPGNTPLNIYTQNHPQVYDIANIVELHKVYKHKFLHLTGGIRKKLIHYSDYPTKVNEIRLKLGLKQLEY